MAMPPPFDGAVPATQVGGQNCPYFPLESLSCIGYPEWRRKLKRQSLLSVMKGRTGRKVMRESLSVLPLSNIHTEKFFMRILKSSIQKLCFITLLLVILFVSLWFPQQSEAQSVVSVSLSQVQCNTTGTVSAQSKFRRHDKIHQRHHKRHQKASFDNRQIVTPTPSPNPCPTTSSSPSSQPTALVYHDASTDCCAQALATMI